MDTSDKQDPPDLYASVAQPSSRQTTDTITAPPHNEYDVIDRSNTATSVSAPAVGQADTHEGEVYNVAYPVVPSTLTCPSDVDGYACLSST